jgi:CRP-like cAMP-binding protein
MKSFIDKLREFPALSEKSLNEIVAICEVRKFDKNEFVLCLDEVCNHMYFVSNGLLRIYYYKEYKDISEWFAFENSFCFSIISYFTKTPSKLIIQCIEDSEVIFISRDAINQLRETNIEIANFMFELTSGSLIFSQERMFGIQFETAQQRYNHLMNQHKNMLQRIPLQYIASYLGISAETLSRIRNHVN